MGKHRVYEIAKEINTDSKAVLAFLAGRQITVKNHMSSVDDSVRDLIVNNLGKKGTNQAPKAATPVRENPPVRTAPTEKQHPMRVQTPVVKHESKPAAVQERTVTPAAPVIKPIVVVRRANPQGQAAAHTNNQQGNGTQKIIIHRPNSRPQGQYAQNRPQGNRPQGQGYQGQGQQRPYNNNRPQGNRPQGYQPNPRFQNHPNQGRPGGQRPQGQDYQQKRFAGNRPQGQGYQGQGGQQRPYNNRSQGGRPQGNRQQFSKPAAPEPVVDINAAHAGKEMGKRGKEFKKKKEFQGRYAQRDSRPNRNTDHLGRRNKHQNMNQKVEVKPIVEIVRPTSVEVGDHINVKDFAQLIKREVSEVIKHLFLLGTMVTINQEIDHDTAVVVGEEFGCEVKELPPEEDPTEIPEVEDDPALRVPRPPVVTVMGHVDHGKTSLLDAIRKTHVTAREAGGITQHIGAYKVTCQGKPIVFLDTPGHEAFTAMRARGAQVTDVAVLVVAADDGVMPQTMEAINHAKAAKVPIIVAINKIDKEGANPEFVKQQLAEHELIPEDWGGDTIMVPVSAHQKTGIAELLEMILLVAEVQELKANPNLPAHGTIIEAQLDKGRGPVATVLISRGTLHIGDTILAGTAYGKVRAMINDRGEKVKKALPSTPVEVLGLNDVPMAGDILDATEEHIARSVAEKRIAKKKDEEQKKAKVSLDDIFNRIQEGELKELNIVVKADVQGTIEALQQSLGGIKNDEVKVVVVHSGVGAINETDVLLASAANALIIGFNVRPDANARKAAETEKVDIRTYRVIYDAINDVEAAIKGMLAPKFKENVIGHVEVRQVITISKMLIAGGYVLDGKITNSAQVRLLRNGIVVHEGTIESLRRFKDDVREVAAGFECGLTLTDYRDIKEGDQLEVYVMEKVAAE